MGDEQVEQDLVVNLLELDEDLNHIITKFSKKKTNFRDLVKKVFNLYNQII